MKVVIILSIFVLFIAAVAAQNTAGNSIADILTGAIHVITAAIGSKKNAQEIFL